MDLKTLIVCLEGETYDFAAHRLRPKWLTTLLTACSRPVNCSLRRINTNTLLGFLELTPVREERLLTVVSSLASQ